MERFRVVVCRCEQEDTQEEGPLLTPGAPGSLRTTSDGENRGRVSTIAWGQGLEEEEEGWAGYGGGGGGGIERWWRRWLLW